MPILLKLFPKVSKDRTLPNSLSKATITLIPKPGMISQKRKITGWVSWWTQDTKILNKIPANRIQQYTERSYTTATGIYQRCADFSVSANQRHYINHLKNKNRMIISTDAEKSVRQIQPHLWSKTLHKMDIEGIFNIIKTIYNRHITIVISNGEEPKASPLRLWAREGRPLLSNMYGSPSHGDQRRKIKGIRTGKEASPRHCRWHATARRSPAAAAETSWGPAVSAVRCTHKRYTETPCVFTR